MRNGYHRANDANPGNTGRIRRADSRNLIICRDTSINAIFERAYQKVYDSIREG